MKILTIGSKAENILLEMAIKDMNIGLRPKQYNNLITALSTMQIETHVPDIILISSGIILLEGSEKLVQMIRDNRLKSIPIIVLVEFVGEEKYLFSETLNCTALKNNKIRRFKMKVFISWSGTLSHKVALILRDWLPSVLQSLQPYVSSEDIDKGTRWSTDISKELEQSAYGILCVTKDNLEASWLNFEAGALSKAFDKSRVSPFLIGVKRAEIKGPILQFQSTIIEKDDIKKLLHSLNKACELNFLEEVRLDSIFDVWWPKLKEKLDSVIQQEYKIEEKSPQEDKKNKSTINNEMIEEILELVRSQQKILKTPETLFPPDYINYILRLSKEFNPFISKAVEDIFLRYRDLRDYLSSCKDLGELSMTELIDKVEMLGRPLEVIIHNSDNRMNFRLRKLVK